jgi:hypothetical protein
VRTLFPNISRRQEASSRLGGPSRFSGPSEFSEDDSGAEDLPVAEPAGTADEPPGLRILLQPKPLILTGLPYRRDDSRREVTRVARTGTASCLRVTYIATDSRHPLPYGTDRSLLAWITTKAFQDRSVRFSAIADYFRAFGLDRGGRSYLLFRERFQRIANLAIRIEQIEDGTRHVRRLFLIPSACEPLELSRGPTERLDRRLLAYGRYGFHLDREFWSYLKATRVPTPVALLRAFHHSPLRWDFAQLVLYRSFASKSAAVVPWHALVEQLGTEDRDHRRLKWQLEGALATIRLHQPSFPARFLPSLRGLLIEPWRPAPSGGAIRRSRSHEDVLS